jgi:hypothetical protein
MESTSSIPFALRFNIIWCVLRPKDILMRVIAEKLAPDSTPVEKV